MPRLRPALLALLALLPAVPAAAGEKDLLANGGFERGLEGWEARNVSGALTVDIDTKVRGAGKASARLLVRGGPGQFRADGLACPLPGIPAGVKVAVSAMVRGREMGNGWLKFTVYDGEGTQLLDHVAVNDAGLTGTFDWRRVEREFEVPEEAVRAEICLFLYLDGECWLDEVSVVPLGKPKPRKPERSEPLDAGTRRWLDGNSVKVKHLRLRGGLEDLAPLRGILKDARIVQLGENTHRDGACFEAKARLVRFLHEEMGFEVLAFESGLYECERANALLGRGEGGAALRGSLFGIWRNGTVEGLFDWLAAEARGGSPMALAGFDCRASGELAAGLLDAVAAFLAPAGGMPAGDLAALKALEAAMAEQGDAYAPPERALAAGRAAWERARRTLDANREALAARHGEAETAFLSRVLDNWRDREAFERSKSDRTLGPHGPTNLRDGAMAGNLRWLAETRFPGKRIVTWGATFHLARGLGGVRVEGNPRYYEGCRNMGQAVHEAYGKEVYTIGFAAHGGKGGAFGRDFDIPKPRKDSVEDVLHRYGAPLLFVDLRPAEGPFRRRLRMAPMSYSRDMEAEWPTVLDGVFYIEEMTPAR